MFDGAVWLPLRDQPQPVCHNARRESWAICGLCQEVFLRPPPVDHVCQQIKNHLWCFFCIFVVSPPVVQPRLWQRSGVRGELLVVQWEDARVLDGPQGSKGGPVGEPLSQNVVWIA